MENLDRLHDVRKVDGKYRVQVGNGMCLAMSLDDWREALKQMEALEALEAKENWLD